MRFATRPSQEEAGCDGSASSSRKFINNIRFFYILHWSVVWIVFACLKSRGYRLYGNTIYIFREFTNWHAKLKHHSDSREPICHRAFDVHFFFHFLFLLKLRIICPQDGCTLANSPGLLHDKQCTLHPRSIPAFLSLKIIRRPAAFSRKIFAPKNSPVGHHFWIFLDFPQKACRYLKCSFLCFRQAAKLISLFVGCGW